MARQRQQKKGGDNIDFSGHKKVKGDKVVAFCDRNCNVIAPFVPAPGNRNESPLLREGSVAIRRCDMICADKTNPMPDETDPDASLSACI